MRKETSMPQTSAKTILENTRESGEGHGPRCG
jgi:hypothetical protein